MKRSVTAAIAILALGACAPRPPAIPQEAKGFMQFTSVDCSGPEHEIYDCYAAAAQVCPGGFDIVDSDGDLVPEKYPDQLSVFVCCTDDGSSPKK
jgi:hypothetical protein